MTKFTRNAIKETFMQLLNEKPLDKISVRDVVESCGISRNTFYYHYHDIYEVLEEILEEERAKTLGDFSEWNSLEEGIRGTTHFALQNRRAVYHIYHSMNRENLEKFFCRVFGEWMTDFVRKQVEHATIDETDIQLISMFYTHGVVGIYLEWLDNNMEGEIDYIIDRIGFLLKGTIRTCLVRPEPEGILYKVEPGQEQAE